MRSTMILMSVATFVSLSLAVSIPGLPSCAGGCVPEDLGGCNAIDANCICTNSDLITNLACCVSTACSQADQDTTIQFANAICAGQGVSDLPSAATCASTVAATSAASSSSATVTASSSSVTTGSAASSLSSLISSASGVAASVSSSAASTASSPSGSSTGTAAATTTAATSAAAASTGAAGRVEVGMGLGALLAGAFVAL